MLTNTCRRCQGTGTVKFTHVDHGRCWACQGKADTSYTRNAPTGEETRAAFLVVLAERRTRRMVAR